MTAEAGAPRVSFVLLAYNQERFVGEAVAGALAQTHAPLEILLSDDASTDRTFAIMSEAAAAYRGPHRILLNRNPTNLGIGAHVNRAVALTSGELIVGAAGDDVSLPERAAELWRAWRASDGRALSLDSDYQPVDESGSPAGVGPPPRLPESGQLEYFSRTLSNGVHGCAHAWSRRLFDVFGPLPDVTCEDVALPPRAMLLGRVAHVPRVLVKYRIHGGNVFGSSRALTAEEESAKNAFFLNDRANACADVLRCLAARAAEPDAAPRRAELERCAARIASGRRGLLLKRDVLTGAAGTRLSALAAYALSRGLRRDELSLILCALHRPSYLAWRDRRLRAARGDA